MSDQIFEKNMEEIFDVDVSNTPEGGCAKRKDQLRDVSEDRDKDYEYTRGELYSLIDQGQEAVRGALEVAQESGHFTVACPKDMSMYTDACMCMLQYHGLKNG